MTLRNRDRFSSTVDKELLSGLKKLSEETRIPISKLLDEAIIDLLKKHKR